MAKVFKTTYPKGPRALDGLLINDEHAVLNEVSVFTADGTDKSGATVLQAPDIVVGVFQVTDAANTCSYADGDYQAPCSSRNRYTIRAHVWNSSTEVWEEYDEDLRVDASCRFGTRQGLFKGEKFSGIFDRQRGWFVPVAVPAAYHLKLDEELAASDGVNVTSATATVQMRDSATNQFSDAVDGDGDVMHVEVYSWYSSSVASGTRIMAVRDGFGDLWLAAVDCP